jgi:ankyrin repeat protein
MSEGLAKIARMVQPESLKSEEYQPWSRGRGVDVWAMLCAAAAGDLKTIKELVAREPGLVECEYEYHKPLHFAVLENRREVVEFLLEKGANPAEGLFEQPLMMACDRGYTELAGLLESRLKEKHHIVPEGAQIAALIKSRDVAAVRVLLEKQPELLHAADDRGNQPIHWAVMTRQVDLIDDLLARGADINAQRPDGARPLHLTNGDYYYRGWRDVPTTALRRHEVLIGYLLARGAEYDISTAAAIGHLDRVRELLDQDPRLANRVPDYSTYYSGLPLRCAAGAGHRDVVELLLQRGANPNGPEPGVAPQGGALHAAIGGKHQAVVKLLLEHGADPNASVESSGNCLSMARHAGAPREMVDLIASYGGARTVELVCYDGDVETLAAMLHANPQLHFDEHAVHCVISEGHLQAMELILRYQPDILRRMTLRRAKTPDFGRWLMERGLDPNRGNWLDVTPLHRCGSDGNTELADVCLEFGADIDAIDVEYCSTPLGWAARAGRKEMVEWLLRKGATPELPADKPWARPLAWAQRRGHHEIIEASQ